ncbi:MAG: right-handed parallel beta-helix repeat-containing protein [Pseudomonadota bacterium]
MSNSTVYRITHFTDRRRQHRRLRWAGLATVWWAVAAAAAPLETTFTYQGELTDNASPANGAYDFEFAIFDVANGGIPLEAVIQLDEVDVAAGVFSVELDFGSAPFNGDQLWLAIGVREGSSMGGFTGLLPRQKLTAAPFALHAERVALDAVTSAEIADDTITADDLADDAVGTQAVQDGAITQSKLAGQSVGQSEIISTQVQRRIDGSCAVDSAVAAIGEDGSVSCVPATGYTDGDAVAAVLDADGSGSLLDADLLDGLEAIDLIAAASDEVALPIGQADLPFLIDSPGSYYLTENLSFPGQDSAAIRITTNDVTLDLRGFSLTGDGLGTGSGIQFFGAQIVIKDGRVMRFGGDGIESTLTSANNTRLEDIVASNNGGQGIALSGSSNFLVDCTARANGADGISSGGGSLIVQSIAQSNGGNGISVGSDSNVERTTSTFNQGAGIQLGTRSRAGGNVASFNVESGIAGLGDNFITDNRLTNNNTGNNSFQGGIRTGAESLVSDNSLSKNAISGVYVTGNGTLVDNNTIAVDGAAVGLRFASNTTNAYRNNVVYNQAIAAVPSAENLGGNEFFEP